MSKGRVMKRTLVAVSLIAAATVGMSGAGVAAESGAGCSEPEPKRTYAHDRIVYGLAVDLTDCDWWDGSPIQLEADLERLDGLEGYGAWSGTVCGVPAALLSRNDEPATKQAALPRSGVCEIQVSIKHPPFETAYYRGEVTFPARGGRRSLSFTALCGQPASCVELPVDPMPTLAPVGDLIVGDDAS